MKKTSHKQKEWMYEKWCLGYSQATIAAALDVSIKTVSRAIHGRPKIMPILQYIKFVCDGGGDEPENLITLCKNCHKKRHKKKVNGEEE